MAQSTKNSYTDEERLKLAEKLDKELDDFISGLERKQYTDGWPEDKWREEFEKHPFFMTKTPEPGDELHPLLEGIQQLKYDPDENTPEELAKSYKEDGNFYFKNKNYRMAFYSYTEGIKTKCDDSEILASLYNNRSAASYFLKNYRSCLSDCRIALKLKPNYDKVTIRAAHCCLELEKLEECMEICNRLLAKNLDNQEIHNLKQNCLLKIKQKERDNRKIQFLDKKHKNLEEKLIKEIVSRGINVEGGKEALSLEKLEPHFPEIVNSRVFLDDNNKLVWPVVVLYPEYQIMDFIQQFHEDDKFIDQISEVLKEPPEWDTLKKYRPDNVNIYFENPSKIKLHKVDLNDNLGNIINSPEFLLRGGTPSFICLPSNSPTEKNFLKQY